MPLQNVKVDVTHEVVVELSKVLAVHGRACALFVDTLRLDGLLQVVLEVHQVLDGVATLASDGSVAGCGVLASGPAGDGGAGGRRSGGSGGRGGRRRIEP